MQTMKTKLALAAGATLMLALVGCNKPAETTTTEAATAPEMAATMAPAEEMPAMPSTVVPAEPMTAAAATTAVMPAEASTAAADAAVAPTE